VVGPGAAVVCHVPLANRLVAAALTITGGLTVIGTVTACAFWLGVWHPLAVHLGLLVASVASLLLRVRDRGRVRTPADVLPAERHGGRDTSAPVRALPWVVLAASVPLWVWAIVSTDPAGVGDFGLTFGLGAPFVAALVLVCGAFVLELYTACRTLVLVTAIAGFLVLTRATAPLMLAYPEYSWTFKHFGVVELINLHGHITDGADIYQQWPAFFSASAQLSAIAGAAPITYGAWSPLFFGVLDAVLVAGLCRALTGDRRVLHLAVFVFGCAAWPETNYFSPQAFAYALVLGCYLIMVLWLRGAPPPHSRLSSLLRGAPGAVRSGPPSYAAMVAVALVFFAICAAHQLSPYLVLAPIGAATVLRLVRPRYLVVALAVIAAAYAVPRLGGVISEYSIFSGLNPFANGAGNATNGWATDGQVFSAVLARATCFALWGAALLLALLRRRWLGGIALPLVLAFAPFALVLVTSYGGEIIYRVYVFSIPTCALLAAILWLGRTRVRVLTALASAVVLCVLCLASQQAVQGQFRLDRVPPSEITAAEYLYAHAEPGSSVLLAARNFPARLTANYDRFNIGLGTDPALMDEAEFHDVTFGPASVPAVTDWVRSFTGTRHYLVVSEPMIAYVHYFGFLPPGSLEGLTAALKDAPEWSVFYDDGQTTIFELTG
jgi:hypothetical protein